MGNFTIMENIINEKGSQMFLLSLMLCIGVIFLLLPSGELLHVTVSNQFKFACHLRLALGFNDLFAVVQD